MDRRKGSPKALGHAKLTGEMKTGFWRSIGRFILWDYPRASWQYDVMVALILAFLFLTPRGWFRDQPRPASIVVLEGHEGADMLWLAPELLEGVPEGERPKRAAALIEAKLGRKVDIIRLDSILDAEKAPTGYLALIRR